MTPADLLAAALREEPARAFVTFYDDATGERAELSVATFANWVAKTANFTRDALGLDVGDRVAIALPCHWQALVWWQACWSAGLVVAAADAPADAMVRSAAWPDDAASPEPDVSRAGEVVALGLGPMGLPVRGGSVPAGAVEFDREIHGHGDRFVPPPGLTSTTVALAGPDGPLTAGELVEAATSAAHRWSLTGQDRVLVTTPLLDAGTAVAALLAPLASGAAVVLVRHSDRADEATRSRRLHDEAVTAVARPSAAALDSGFRRSVLRPLD